VLIAHPKNPVASLTLHQIYDIYYGRITNWKDLGGEDRPINLYAIAAPLDGIEFSVREVVFRNGDQRIAAPRLYLNTTKLEEAVAIDPAGLGLSTFASTYANKGVKALGVEGINASTTSIGDGSYPLYITLYLAEKVDSPKQDAIGRFIAFLDTPSAKDILRKHQLIPYGDSTEALAHASARTAFIDAKLGREPGTAVTAVAAVTPAPIAASVPTPTPVAAPRATLEAKSRIAPTAESTEQARANLARAEAKAAEKKAAKAEAAKADKPAPKKKTAVAKADKKPADKKPAEKPAANFGNVDAAAKTAAKPVSFGDVSSGAKTADPNKPN